MNNSIALPIDKLESATQRITVALFVVQSIVSAAITNAFTVTPILAVMLGGSDNFAGYPSTFQAVGRALAAYPIGWLMDKIGRRVALSSGYFVGLLGTVVLVWGVIQGSLGLFLLGSVLFGMMRAGTEQSRFVAAEVNLPDQRARVMGFLVFAGTFGSIVGPSMVPWADRLGQAQGLPENAGPFFVAMVAIAICVLILITTLRPDPLQIGRQITAEVGLKMPAITTPTITRSLRQIYNNRIIWLAVLSMVTGQLVMSFLMVIAPVHMQHHDHTKTAISGVITAHTMGMFGFAILTGWLVDRIGQYWVIGIGALILIASAIILPISPNFVPMAVALFLVGLGWNFCYVAGSSLLSDSLTSEERGRAQGANDFMVAVGAGSGALLSGIIYAQFDAGILAVSTTGLSLAIILLLVTFWVALTRPRPGL